MIECEIFQVIQTYIWDILIQISVYPKMLLIISFFEFTL